MQLQETGISMIDASVPLVGATYTAGKHEVVFGDAVTKCKGLYCKSGTATVVVHPIRNPVNVNFTVVLAEGSPFGVAFDYVVEAGTDAALTHVSAIPM
jgi:hypothetical protein